MNFLRKVSFIVIFCLSFLANAKEPMTICLTGRVVENFSSYGETFVNAANLAVDQSSIKKLVIIKKYFYDNRPLSPIVAYKKMLKDNCAAIIGFEYLSDLLLITKNQGKNKIPIFTSYASTLGQNNLPENVFIFMPSYRFLASKMVKFSRKKFGHLDHVLIITEINRDSMRQYRQAYIEEFKKNDIQYKTFDILENDNHLARKLRYFIKSEDHFDYVFVLSGVIASAKIINELSNEKTIFFGTENFGSSNAPSLWIKLSNKNVHSYFIRNFDSIKRSETLESFEKAYEKTFSKKPLSIAAYTYDSTRIILNSIQRYKEINLNNILDTDYVGASGIKIKSGIFYRSPEYIILKITPNGYQDAESIIN